MDNPLLARQGLDFGLPTDSQQDRRAFYDALGLSHLRTEELGPGQNEVYYTAHGSWLKFVTSDEPLPSGVSGYHELLIADPRAGEPMTLVDPDGLVVSVVPRGYRGIQEMGLVMRVHDVDGQERLLVDGLRAEKTAEGLRVGNTVFFLEEDATPMTPGPMFARGFTWVALVVHDIVQTQKELLAAGAGPGMRICTDPRTPGRCVYSFLSDPNGNWIELVQFAELSGPLPPPADPAPTLEEIPSGSETTGYPPEGIDPVPPRLRNDAPRMEGCRHGDSAASRHLDVTPRHPPLLLSEYLVPAFRRPLFLGNVQGGLP